MSDNISLNDFEKEMLEIKLKQLQEKKKQKLLNSIDKNNSNAKKRNANESPDKSRNKKLKKGNSEENEIEVIENYKNDDNWKSLNDINPAPLEEEDIPKIKKTSFLDNLVINEPKIVDDDDEIEIINECNKIFITIEIDDKKEKVALNENDCFDKVFAFLDKKNYEFKCLYNNKERILPTTTTKDLLLLGGDAITIRATKEIEGKKENANNEFDGEMKSYEEEKNDEDNKPKVSINLKLFGQKERIAVSLSPDGTFDKIVNYLLETRSYVVEKMIFDGEKIDLNSTPEDLEVEAGDEIQIDIKGHLLEK